jgi:MerR family transcriptional regulator, light-induced transcriptional regulator
VAAAEAARLALAEDAEQRERQNDRPALTKLAAELREALDRLDESGAHRALDGLFASFTLETALARAILPYLTELGERWAEGEVSVGQEHFASNVLRGRLLALARGWDAGAGPRAVLACAPGEQHDLGLISFGLVLRARGWRIAFLGPDTPLESAVETARSLAADLVVISATDAERFSGSIQPLARLADAVRVGVAGAGATRELAEATGAELLDLGPVEAAQLVAGR